MATYPVNDIATILSGRLFPSGEGGLQAIRFLSFDSRTILSGNETLFFALKSDRNDGHRFIGDAWEKGVRTFVVEQLPDNLLPFVGASFIKVENSLKALQALAAYHRRQFSYPVAAITGSNGKTIVKEWLAELLSPQLTIVRSPRSYNSQIGNPLSVWLMNSHSDLALFEAGISKPGEMATLNDILAPDHVVFTHIGNAHLENFSSAKTLVGEKVKLATGCRLICYCSDFVLLAQAIEKMAFQPPPRLFRWSVSDSNADLYILSKIKGVDGTTINAIYQKKEVQIAVPFTDEAHIENAIHCWAYLLATGNKTADYAGAFARLTTIAMRMEIKKGINGCAIIDDSYNSDTVSIVNALDFLRQQSDSGKQQSCVIISDILQTGRNPEALYAEVAEYMALRSIGKVIGVGEQISKYGHLFTAATTRFYPTTEEFLLHFKEFDYHNEVILLKGARAFRFDRISGLLQQKAHQTVMEIDLGAMVHNLNLYRRKLKPETKVMVMVKAFSYGTGSVEVARILQFVRADYLAVAIADEGVELRNNGIELPIIVMNPEEHSFDTMIENRLEPNIYRFELLQRFEEALRRNAVSNFPIHIKIDTGMKRLGFDTLHDIEKVASFIAQRQTIYVKSVFTHLAVSDDEQNDTFTRKQFADFERFSQAIVRRFDHPILRHILNSSGIERFPEMQLDMVRLGIGLYGVSPTIQNELRHVATLKTTISQIRRVEAGDTVGYGRRGKIKHPARIAVLPIGYADGFSRRLSNGVGKVVINGQQARIVGTICMDMCMVDVTGIEAKEGDRVVIFGEEQPVSQVAEWLGTIAYEVLTTVGQRVKRIYFTE